MEDKDEIRRAEPEIDAEPETESAPDTAPAEVLPLDVDPEPAEPQENTDTGSGGDTEAAAGESRPKRRVRLSRDNAMLLTGTALTAVLMAVAMIWDLPDPAWSILMIAGFLISLLPLALRGLLLLRDRGRFPEPLIMLACVMTSALTGRMLPAAIAATVYNLLSAVYNMLTQRELDYVRERLERFKVGKRGILAGRVENHIGEISGMRMRPLLAARRLERLLLLVAVALTAVLAVVPALLDGMTFVKWINRALIILVMCVFDCDRGVAMNWFNGSEAAFSGGIYTSGINVLGSAAQVSSVFFNKSGTITDGSYRVVNLEPVRLSDEELLFLATMADAYSDHPLARAIRDRSGVEADRSRILRHREEPGYGSLVQLTGSQLVAVGSIDFMEGLGVRGDMYTGSGTCAFVAVNRTCVGRIDFEDTLCRDAVSVVPALKRAHVANIGIMTGDNALSATGVGREIGITEIYSDCRPRDKSARLRYVLETQERDDRLMFISGDRGDRELLEMANISVSLGLAQDCTVSFPDVVLPPDGLMKAPALIRISQRMRKNDSVNFAVSAVARVLTAVLGLAGVMPMWAAVIVIFALQFWTVINSRVTEE